MSDIHGEIELACSGIKHVPEDVDLADVRALLRRCQYEIERYERLLRSATLPGSAVLDVLDYVDD